MFKIRKGTNRWNTTFIKTKESKVIDQSRETVESRDRAMVGGHRQNKPAEDRKWQNSAFSFGSRRLKEKSMKNKVIRNQELEEDLDKQQERLFDHHVGGIGGFNQDHQKLEKDKAVTKIVKEDDKVEAKPQNEWNTAENAGAYTGGKSRSAFLKKNKLLEI